MESVIKGLRVFEEQETVFKGACLSMRREIVDDKSWRYEDNERGGEE